MVSCRDMCHIVRNANQWAEDMSEDAAFVTELRLALQHVGRRIRRRMGAELSPAKYSVLSAVSRHPGATLGMIGRLEQLGKSAITRLSAELESLELIARTPDPSDGRGTCVRITAKGSRMLAKANAHMDGYLRLQLSGLDAQDVKILDAAVPVLRRLLDARVPTVGSESTDGE